METHDKPRKPEEIQEDILKQLTALVVAVEEATASLDALITQVTRIADRP